MNNIITNYSDKFLNLFFIFFSILPLSFILGSGVWNINFFLLAVFGLISVLTNLEKLNIILNDNKYFIYILAFFSIYIIMGSFYSDYINDSLTRSIPFLKYLFIFLGLYLFKNNIEISRSLVIFHFSVLSICVFIVIISSLAELFRLEIPIYTKSSVDYRLNGPFGDEAIVGSYLFSFLPSIIFMSLLFNFNLKLKVVLLSLIFFVILASGERMVMIMCSSLFFFYLLPKYTKTIIFTTLVTSLIVSVILINKDTILKKTRGDISYVFRMNQTIGEILDPFSTSYFIHYKTALEIFKSNKIFGTGVKSYRYECSKDIYLQVHDSKDLRCRTHPHNLHLEVLSETGLIGYLLFLMLVYFFIKSNCKINLNEKNLILILALFITIFPLRVSGSIFSSIYGGLFWYQFFVILIFSNKKIK